MPSPVPATHFFSSVQHTFEVLGPARFTEYPTNSADECAGHRVSRDLDMKWMQSNQEARRAQSTAELRVDAAAKSGDIISLAAAFAGDFGTVYITEKCTLRVEMAGIGLSGTERSEDCPAR